MFQTDCEVDAIPNSDRNIPFKFSHKTNVTINCDMYYLPDGNTTRYCIKGRIYPDFITNPLTCKSKLNYIVKLLKYLLIKQVNLT